MTVRDTATSTGTSEHRFEQKRLLRQELTDDERRHIVDTFSHTIWHNLTQRSLANCDLFSNDHVIDRSIRNNKSRSDRDIGQVWKEKTGKSIVYGILLTVHRRRPASQILPHPTDRPTWARASIAQRVCITVVRFFSDKCNPLFLYMWSKRNEQAKHMLPPETSVHRERNSRTRQIGLTWSRISLYRSRHWQEACTRYR